MKLYALTLIIYQISHVFSESDRLSLAIGKDVKRCMALANTYISAIQTFLIGVVVIAQLIEVTDSAVLCGVVEA